MANIIFYFTGTGNSLKIAKDIADGIGECTLVSMGKAHKLQGTYERIGFVYPVYGFGMPNAVERFVKNLDLSQNKNSYIFGICTSGSTSGGLPNLSKLVASKGGKFSYGINVPCFSNYIAMYSMGDDPKGKVKAQAAQTKPIVADIHNRTIKQDFKNIALSFAHGVFVKTLPKKDKEFNISDACNGCETCAKICPVENIKMQNGKPEFLHHCEQCVACIQWCPKQAINMGNKTQSRGRYHHPDITLSDMMRKE